jgi:hypothetical protein
MVSKRVIAEGVSTLTYCLLTVEHRQTLAIIYILVFTQGSCDNPVK